MIKYFYLKCIEGDSIDCTLLSLSFKKPKALNKNENLNTKHKSAANGMNVFFFLSVYDNLIRE